LYFSSLASLMHEREALHAALVKADGALSECQRQLLGIDGTLDQLAVLDRLTSNLKKEHVLRIMLNCFVWGRILTSVQFAKTAGGLGPVWVWVWLRVRVGCEEVACCPCAACYASGRIPASVQFAKTAGRRLLQS
jgi:hypothetical protein